MYSTHVDRLAMKPVADLSEADCKADPIDVVEAGPGQPPARSEAETHVPGQLPPDQRGEILRGIAQCKAPGISQAAIGFRAQHDFIGAKRKFVSSRGTAQWMRNSQCIAE